MAVAFQTYAYLFQTAVSSVSRIPSGQIQDLCDFRIIQIAEIVQMNHHHFLFWKTVYCLIKFLL